MTFEQRRLSTATLEGLNHVSAAAFRVGVSGLLEPDDVVPPAAATADRGGGNDSSRKNATADTFWWSTIAQGNTAASSSLNNRSVPLCPLPAVPYYGMVKSVSIEIPVEVHHHHAGSSSTKLSSSSLSSSAPFLNDGVVGSRVRLLPKLLDTWARSGGGGGGGDGGGGALYEYGNGGLRSRFGAGGARQYIAGPLAQGGARGEDGQGSVSSGGAPKMSSSSNSRLLLQAAALAGGSCWYGEYVEALTDAIMCFHQLRKSTNGACHGGRACLSPPVLYLEWSMHPRWRAISAMWCVEDDAPCCFVACSHRPTQRHLSHLCEEVGVELVWIAGATFVTSSSSPSSSGDSAAATTSSALPQKKEEEEVEDEGGRSMKEKSRRRCREPAANPCRVLSDVLLNLNVLVASGSSLSAMEGLLPRDGASSSSSSTTTTTSMSGMVTITANFPFRHSTWQQHTIRATDPVLITPGADAGGCSSRVLLVTFVSATGDHDATFRYEEDGTTTTTTTRRVTAAGGKEEVGDIVGGTATTVFGSHRHHETISCRSRQPPLLGICIPSLLKVLIEDARLNHFRLRFEAYASPLTFTNPKPSTGGGGGVGGAPRATAGLASVRTTAPGANTNSSSSSVVGAAGTVTDGTCYARLSCGAWLSRAEKEQLFALASLINDDEREGEDFDDALLDDGADRVDDESRPSADDMEAHFFVSSMEYHRRCTATRGGQKQQQVIPPNTSTGGRDSHETALGDDDDDEQQQGGGAEEEEGEAEEDVYGWGKCFRWTSVVTALAHESASASTSTAFGEPR